MFYSSDAQHLSVLQDFFLDGFEKNQRVLYISDNLSLGHFIKKFDSSELRLSDRVTHGQFVFKTSKEAYFPSGRFDTNAMFDTLYSQVEISKKLGYSALRAAGEMSWALGAVPGSEQLIDYETRLCEFFEKTNTTALCQYDTRIFKSSKVLASICVHPNCHTEFGLVRNPIYLDIETRLGAGENTTAHFFEEYILKKYSENTLTRQDIEPLLEFIDNHKTNSMTAYADLVNHPKRQVLLREIDFLDRMRERLEYRLQSGINR